MIDLNALRDEVARGMCNKASRNTCHCIGKIKCRLRAEEADAAIALVLRAVAKEADTFVGTGRDINDLIAQIDAIAHEAGGGR